MLMFASLAHNQHTLHVIEVFVFFERWFQLIVRNGWAASVSQVPVEDSAFLEPGHSENFALDQYPRRQNNAASIG